MRPGSSARVDVMTVCMARVPPRTALAGVSGPRPADQLGGDLIHRGDTHQDDQCFGADARESTTPAWWPVTKVTTDGRSRWVSGTPV